MSDEKEKEPRKKPLENSSETVKVRISGRVLAAARAAKAASRFIAVAI